MFLQTGVVLFDRPPALSEVAAALADAPVERRREHDGNTGYWFGGEGMLLVASGSGAEQPATTTKPTRSPTANPRMKAGLLGRSYFNEAAQR